MIIPATPSSEAEAFAKGLLNLLQPRLGAGVAFVTDDFFAPAERIMNPASPVLLVDEYDDDGKWMDRVEDALISRSIYWQELLPRQKLSADNIYEFTELADLGSISQVRLNIFPDGGLSRLRLLGRVAS